MFHRVSFPQWFHLVRQQWKWRRNHIFLTVNARVVRYFWNIPTATLEGGCLVPGGNRFLGA